MRRPHPIAWPRELWHSLTPYQRRVLAAVLVIVLAVSAGIGEALKESNDAHSLAKANRLAVSRIDVATDRTDVNNQNLAHALLCVRQWIGDNNARQAAIDKVSASRLNALDSLARALLTGKPVTFDKAIHTYLSVTADARRDAAKHPIPKTPSLTCVLRDLPNQPSAPVPGKPTPHSSPTRTVTVTRTATPPPRVIYVPGPTVTQRVTVTVTAGPGRPRK